MKKSLSLICIGLVISGYSLFSNIANADNISSFEKCKMSVDRATNAWRRYYDKMDTEAIKGNSIDNIDICDFNLDYTDVIKSCKQAAEEGNAEAQYYLGFAYGEVWCKKADHINAIKWITKSANQNFSFAQTVLARYYLYGKTVNNVKILSKDLQKSLSLYEKAALQNEIFAINELAFYYSHDQPNIYKALNYLNHAKNLKNVNAIWNLGNYQYAITQDIDEALTWYEKAAELKIDLLKTIKVGKMYEEGKVKVDYYNQKGYSVTKKINIKKNKKKALHYYKLACDAKRNNNNSIKVLGIIPEWPGINDSLKGCKLYQKLKSQ